MHLPCKWTAIGLQTAWKSPGGGFGWLGLPGEAQTHLRRRSAESPWLPQLVWFMHLSLKWPPDTPNPNANPRGPTNLAPNWNSNPLLGVAAPATARRETTTRKLSAFPAEGVAGIFLPLRAERRL